MNLFGAGGRYKTEKEDVTIGDTDTRKEIIVFCIKAMNCRNIEKVMKAYAKANASPVISSKRQNVKWLRNIYDYLPD